MDATQSFSATPVIQSQHPTDPPRRVLPSITAKNFLAAAVQVPENFHVGCISNPLSSNQTAIARHVGSTQGPL
jgi:hypothetical protein